MARISSYSDKIASEICREIAEGKSMKTICKSPGTPDPATIYRWLNDNEKFCEMYTRAKQEQAEAFVEEMIDIAATEEDVNRARLMIETRKWCAAKLKPAKYGEQKKVVDVNISNYQKWVQEEILVVESVKELGTSEDNHED